MTARRGRYSAGEETRVLLIETAERLFAQRGYEAVTLAEIRAAAGQHNASVISYYFGSKANLLRAVFEHRLPVINAEREALIRELSATGAELTTREALWALVLPLVDSVRRGHHYAGLLDRLLEAEMLDGAFNSADPEVTTSGLTVNRVLHSALDRLPAELGHRRVRIVYASVMRTLAGFGRSGSYPEEAALADLIDAWDGLLNAPATGRMLRLGAGALPGDAR
ncbi:helix-turn-helix domain-containing protein [Nocardia sp. NPDC024068]|uniref:TetR/AcrR family transcriptional regulator n=1 Tax=Nocardia sp. NPDC024068 TaxID=3157197 RepID=UPI0033C5D724